MVKHYCLTCKEHKVMHDCHIHHNKERNVYMLKGKCSMGHKMNRICSKEQIEEYRKTGDIVPRKKSSPQRRSPSPKKSHSVRACY